MKSDIKRAIEHFKISRETCLKLIDGLTYSQLITIPKGFNNSIFWNVSHLVVTQQLLQYKLSSLPMHISDEIVNDFRKGSVAKSDYSEIIWQKILELFSRLPSQLASDYENELFAKYNEYTTSFGVTLNSIEDAIAFNNIHEGLHIGYIMALKRVVLL
ncbi:MAG: DinB family protein [Crocinitomicaceae bacterium]